MVAAILIVMERATPPFVVLDEFMPKITQHAFQKCNPDWHILEQQVDEHDLTYLIKGGARYTINGVAHELESGDLIYLTEGDIKEAVTYPNNLMQCFSINFIFTAPMFHTAFRSGTTFSVPGAPHTSTRMTGNLFPTVNHIGLRQDIIDMFKELSIAWAEQQNGYTLKTRALLMLIVHRLSEIILYDVDSAPGDFRINKITRYISAHFAEKLTVKNLAKQAGLDVDYFGHLFKRETGMTVHQYITKTRVRNAENLLRTGKCKVQDAAEQCGFSDTFHFYKLFKALRGFPPSRCIPKK